MAYEIYSNYNSDIGYLKTPATQIRQSSFADNQGILNHLDRILNQVNYFEKKSPEITLRKLQNILHKAKLNREEVDLIRGILSKIENKT